MWLDAPAVLTDYARHHETGEPIPGELVERLAATEYLAATLLERGARRRHRRVIHRERRVHA